jgi:hypothetical protein
VNPSWSATRRPPVGWRELGEGADHVLDLARIDAGNGVGHRRNTTLLPLQLPTRDPERGSVDPGQRLSDLAFVLERAGERLGDGVLGEVPSPAREPIDRSPQLRSGIAIQELEVTLSAELLLAPDRHPLAHDPHPKLPAPTSTRTERRRGRSVYDPHPSPAAD